MRRLQIRRGADHTGRRITSITFGRDYSNPTPYVVFLPRYKCAAGKWLWFRTRVGGRPMFRIMGATFYL